jgi:hypothetical protein
MTTMGRRSQYHKAYIQGTGVITKPNVTDNFNRADANLEANSLWTRSGGVAGALAVRSNQLAAPGASVAAPISAQPITMCRPRWCRTSPALACSCAAA